jgi:hypothetical protein
MSVVPWQACSARLSIIGGKAPAPVRLDEVIVSSAPVTLGGGAPLLRRRIELRLDELGRNGDFVSARFSVVRPPA